MADRAPEIALPSAIEGVDLDAGLRRINGNRRLYRQLLLDFGASYPSLIPKVRDLAASGDRDGAARLVHAAKGIAGNLGAGAFLLAAQELEAALLTGLRDLEPLMARAELALAPLLEAARDLAAAVPDPSADADSGGPLDGAALAALVSELRGLLRANDPGALACLERMRALGGTGAFAKDLAEIEAAVGSFDYDTALPAAERMAGALAAGRG